MSDHTEREREARHCTVLAMQRERVERTMKSWDAVFACIDDERAAVRSAVLAEVRAEFNRDFSEQAEHEWDCDMADCSCDKDIQSIVEIYNESRRDFLAALTALEATE